MSDDEEPEDPFEALDVGDRDGDPFEELGPPPDETAPDAAESPATHQSDSQPAGDGDSSTDGSAEGSTPDLFGGPESSPDDESGAGRDSPTGEGSSEGAVRPPTDDPFAGMDDRETDPFGEGESVFESVDVGDVDPDEVWEQLESDPAEPSGTRHAEVSKHRYCEQCEHFSPPPETRCTHEGTEIIEFLDMETVRLRNCPVVSENRELGEEE